MPIAVFSGFREVLTDGCFGQQQKSTRRKFLVCALVLAGCTLLRLFAHPLFGDFLAFSIYLPAIIIATAYAGTIAGMLTSIAAVLLARFFWMEPRFTVVIEDVSQASLLLFNFALAVFVVTILNLLQRAVTLQRDTALELQKQKKALEKSQSELRRHAEDLEKMVAERTASLRDTISDLEAFAYTVSHDLRAPLRAMEGFARAVEEDYRDKLDKEGVDYLDRIKTSVRRMDNLIQDLLTFSHVSRLQKEIEVVNVENLVSEVLQDYASINQPHAEFIIQPPLHPVLGNTSLLLQCVSNLLGNAVKFVGSGQQVVVKIWTEKLGSHVRINVRDNGIGIPETLLEKIFEPFQRGHPHAGYEGTGIGLAIVRKAVEKMGGSLGLTSKVGEGSHFWIELPAAD